MARVLSRGRRGALTPLNFQTRRRDVVLAASRFAGIDWKFSDGRYRAIPGIDYDGDIFVKFADPQNGRHRIQRKIQRETFGQMSPLFSSILVPLFSFALYLRTTACDIFDWRS